MTSSNQLESTEREELLGRVSSKAEFRKTNIQRTSATKQTKIINPPRVTPLSRNPARIQFNTNTTSLQTNAFKQNDNNFKEKSSEIAEEKNLYSSIEMILVIIKDIFKKEKIIVIYGGNNL